MGLIKKIQIEEKGEVTVSRPAALKEAGVSLKPAPTEEKISFRREEPAIEAHRPEEVEIPTPRVITPQKRKEAENIVKKAEQEAQKIREEARQEGIKLGKEEGKKEYEDKIKEALEVLNKAVKERKKIIKDSESEILRLSLKAAEQIIRSEVSLHRDVCLNIVSEAISRVSDREQIIVRVNREDSEYIKKFKDRLTSMLDGVKSFSVLEDSSVEPGGCVIETNLGYVDARISTKIKALAEAFKKVEEKEE